VEKSISYKRPGGLNIDCIPERVGGGNSLRMDAGKRVVFVKR